MRENLKENNMRLCGSLCGLCVLLHTANTLCCLKYWDTLNRSIQYAQQVLEGHGCLLWGNLTELHRALNLTC